MDTCLGGESRRNQEQYNVTIYQDIDFRLLTTLDLT